MIRSFLAIDLPEPVKGRLADYIQRLNPGASGIKWVDPSRIHLTLKFFGSVSQETVESLAETTAQTVEGVIPFSLSLKGVGGFPHIRRPRVIWAGLGGDLAALKNLWPALEEAFFRMGIPREVRPFNPHLTLGRNKTGRPDEKLFLRLSNWDEEETAPFKIRELTLFRSDLKPGGPIYTAIKTFPLTGT